MIVFAIIRVAAADTINGDVDSIWVVFWFQIETSVAVIMVSVSAFRALFVAHTPTRHSPSPTILLPKPYPLARTAESTAQTSWTLEPSFDSHEMRKHTQAKESMESDDMILPMEGTRVGQPIQMHHVGNNLHSESPSFSPLVRESLAPPLVPWLRGSHGSSRS